MANDDIPFDRSLDAKPREVSQVSPLVRRLIASNAGPFTFTGTCTYIVGHDEVVVIDPGPQDKAHCDAILHVVRGLTVKAIVVTHTHRDHSTGAAALKAATGAPLFGPRRAVASSFSDQDAAAVDAAHDQTYAPDHILDGGETLVASDYRLCALTTPGHASNHMAFALPEENALFSGDHVMAWSTTVVAPPDGSMQAYMASLDKLQGRDDAIYWPGHGGPVRQPQRFVRALAHHRRQREQSILTRLRAGDATIGALVRSVYKELAPALRGAAALSVLAHVEHLIERGLVEAEDGAGFSARYGPRSPDQARRG